MLLLTRFGLVQFLRNRGANDEFFYDRWHIYRALFDVFEAEHVSIARVMLFQYGPRYEKTGLNVHV